MKAALHPLQIFAFVFLIIIISGCWKEYSIEDHAAKGTLKDSSGICFPQTLHGTFYNGITPGTDTSFITILVNVTKVGSYSISTDTQNGFGFSNSGTFTSVGINTIDLKPIGTPVEHVPTHFKISFDTSVCSLTVNVHDSTTLHQNTPQDSLPAYNWQFTDSKRGQTYKGIFENNYILKLGPLTVLVLSTRDAQGPGDSTFTMNISFPTGSVTPGTYSTDDPPNGIVFRTFSEPCGNCAGGGLIPISAGATVIIKVTDYDPSTRIVKGLFSGTTIDWVNEIAPIKNGVFTALIQ